MAGLAGKRLLASVGRRGILYVIVLVVPLLRPIGGLNPDQVLGESIEDDIPYCDT